MEHSAAHSGGLSGHFNGKSVGNFLWHGAKHMAVMGLCMAIPAIALAAPMDATLLDVVVQTGHQAWGMAADLFQSTPSVLGSVVENTFAGNIAPTTLESLGMAHGAHGAHAAHTAHAAAQAGAGSSACASPAFEEWLRNAHASGDLGMAMEESQGGNLCDYWASEYGHHKH